MKSAKETAISKSQPRKTYRVLASLVGCVALVAALPLVSASGDVTAHAGAPNTLYCETERIGTDDVLPPSVHRSPVVAAEEDCTATANYRNDWLYAKCNDTGTDEFTPASVWTGARTAVDEDCNVLVEILL